MNMFLATKVEQWEQWKPESLLARETVEEMGVARRKAAICGQARKVTKGGWIGQDFETDVCRRISDVLCAGDAAEEAVAAKRRVLGIPAVETAVVEAAAVETAALETAAAETNAAVETPVAETAGVKTGAVETAVVETAAVETAAEETAAEETAAVETAAEETPAVKTAAVETAALEIAAVETAVAVFDQGGAMGNYHVRFGGSENTTPDP
ncbi:hypothetical protein CBR_g53666 [Chara braunii]|uniref:Uncharacterized protein n=1 Tax=Chara braunii TaxID=69332 RepID=A0A388MB24_CHABU|nr:hypothetical protein CBR_g53666 [Chara braunii]|eukprot:GBG91777.1 hypothetical protein CBR_g53666 [Chara braunii]